MRTKEKSKRATYAKIKRKHPHSRSKNIRQEKHSKHSRHLRQLFIRVFKICQFVVAVSVRVKAAAQRVHLIQIWRRCLLCFECFS